MTGKGPLLFLGLCFAASIGAGLICHTTGGSASRFAQPLGLAVMFVPILASALSRRLSGGAVETISWGRLPVDFTLVAILAIVLASHAALYLGTLLKLGNIPWSTWLTPDAQGNLHPPEQMHIGATISSSVLYGKILFKLFVGLLIASVFTLGEEVGWRGYLLKALGQTSPWKAITLVSLIWAIWHWPFALSGIHHIPGMSRIEILLSMTLGIIGLGLCLGTTYWMTQSIWAVALIHAAVNNWGQFGARWFIQGTDALNPTLLFSQNITLLILGIAFTYAKARA